MQYDWAPLFWEPRAASHTEPPLPATRLGCHRASPAKSNGAQTTETSMSKAIASLVQIGLEGQESRKREFFKKLKANLANDDPARQDRLVDEFRTLILGR